MCSDSLFFVESGSADYENVSGLNVIILPRLLSHNRKIRLILKFLIENHLKNQHFFYLIKGIAFVDKFKLEQILAKTRLDQEIYLGSENCDVSAGNLFSKPFLQKIRE